MTLARKTFATMLAVLMAFMMAIPAFAAGTGSITISNPEAGKTYTAYKIFDVTQNGNDVAYTIKDSSEWYADINNYIRDTGAFTLTQLTAGSDTYLVTKTNNYSAANFANYLKNKVTGKATIDIPVSGNPPQAVVSNLDLGYYYVTHTGNGADAVFNLTTTTPAVTIQDKNHVPFTKTTETEDTQVGDKVTFTIKGIVPDTAGYTTYVYDVADTMTDGLTFNDDIVVTIDGANQAIDNNILKKTTTTNTTTNNLSGFKLSLNPTLIQDKKGQEIVIAYSATVNKHAVSKIDKNNATLTYSNDPSDATSKTTTPPVEEKVFTSTIVIDKFEAGNEAKKLAGAEFKLRNNIVGDAGFGKYYKPTLDASNKVIKVEWVAKDEAPAVATDATGMAKFEGLKNGDYVLEETKVPTGYNPVPPEIAVVVNGNDTNVASLTTTSKVANNTGATLPDTGGVGTIIFTVVGVVLVIGAGALLIAKRRAAKKSYH